MPILTSQLLVSVQNAAESRVAAEAGVGLIDLKNPSAGSLGRMDHLAIGECLREVRAVSAKARVSAALGELTEVEEGLLSGRAFLPESGLAYLKLGLSGMGSVSDWVSRWVRFREAVVPSGSGSSPPGWIAVAYADRRRAEAPQIEDVVSAAISTGCAGLLIDTFDKSGGGVLDYLDQERLLGVVRQVQEAGLLAVLAGKVGWNDLPTLKEIAPDIIAVRSLVCRDGDRRREIDVAAIHLLRERLAQ